MLKEVSKLFSQKIRTVLLIIVGSFAWSLTMVKSGWNRPYGMGFWGANGHDGIWHIALAESLKRNNFGVPTFAGEVIKNYHIGFDLFLGFLSKLTSISVPSLYFQILPPVFALAIGYLVYQFILIWTKSRLSAWWSTFFVYFGGSFGFLIGKGESAFWSQQATSTLINPPFALSLIFILLGLISLQKLVESKKTRYLLFSILYFGVLIEIKAYAGILSLLALLLIGIFRYLRVRKYDFIWVFVGALIISLIVYLPFNKDSQNLIVWQPFWFLETMMGLSDRVGWERFFSAMNTYKSGRIWFKAIPAYFVALVIFYIGNLGTRIFKELLVFRWLKNIKTVGWVEIFTSSIIVAGVLVPMLFLQKGTPWNTIQFFYYSLFFSGILAGVAMGEFLKTPKLNTMLIRIVVVIVVLLTIPTTILTLKYVYIPSRPPAKLSNEELSALRFLAKQPEGTVLTYLFDSNKAKEAEGTPPRPLYLYTSTAYVSAFSKHQVFLEDEINLDITGYDWRNRRSAIEAWYKESNEVKAREFLKKNNIKYVYWVKPQRALLGEGNLGFKNIFENSETVVYRVD